MQIIDPATVSETVRQDDATPPHHGRIRTLRPRRLSARRPERRAGELLREQELAKGGNPNLATPTAKERGALFGNCSGTRWVAGRCLDGVITLSFAQKGGGMANGENIMRDFINRIATRLSVNLDEGAGPLQHGLIALFVALAMLGTFILLAGRFAGPGHQATQADNGALSVPLPNEAKPAVSDRSQSDGGNPPIERANEQPKPTLGAEPAAPLPPAAPSAGETGAKAPAATGSDASPHAKKVKAQKKPVERPLAHKPASPR